MGAWSNARSRGRSVRMSYSDRVDPVVVVGSIRGCCAKCGTKQCNHTVEWDDKRYAYCDACMGLLRVPWYQRMLDGVAESKAEVALADADLIAKSAMVDYCRAEVMRLSAETASAKEMARLARARVLDLRAAISELNAILDMNRSEIA